MPLNPVDPNLPSSSSSTSTTMSHTILTSKDKDKSTMREWTFPRTSPSSSPHSSPNPNNNNNNGSSTTLNLGTSSSTSNGSSGSGSGNASNNDVAHGRTSSTTYGSSANGGGGLNSISEDSTSPTTTTSNPKSFTSFRHRTNASTTASRFSTAASSSSSSSPLRRGSLKPQAVAKLVYSNVRRRSLSDLIWFGIFTVTLVLFSSALFGIGYSPASSSSSSVGMNGGRERRATTEQVVIPNGFLPIEEEEKAPADVHQPEGDSSHDVGEELMRDSPEDEGLDDEKVHEVYHHDAPNALFHPHDGHDESGEEALPPPQNVEIIPDEDELDLSPMEHDDTSLEEEASEEEVDDLARHGELHDGGHSHGHDDASSEEEEEESIEEEEDGQGGERLSVDDVPEGEGDPNDVPADDPSEWEEVEESVGAEGEVEKSPEELEVDAEEGFEESEIEEVEVEEKKVDEGERKKRENREKWLESLKEGSEIVEEDEVILVGGGGGAKKEGRGREGKRARLLR